MGAQVVRKQKTISKSRLDRGCGFVVLGCDKDLRGWVIGLNSEMHHRGLVPTMNHRKNFKVAIALPSAKEGMFDIVFEVRKDAKYDIEKLMAWAKDFPETVLLSKYK